LTGAANLTAVAAISGGAVTDLLVKGNIDVEGDKSATLEMLLHGLPSPEVPRV